MCPLSTTHRWRSGEAALARPLEDNADEPHAPLIALETTHAVDRLLRVGRSSAYPCLAKADAKMSTRRTFQALRTAVNDEHAALDQAERILEPHVLCGQR